MLQEPHREVLLDDLHASLLLRRTIRPDRPREGIWENASTDIFDERDIDRERGALIVVRPDQYVAHVLPLDAYAESDAFLRPIFRTDPVLETARKCQPKSIALTGFPDSPAALSAVLDSGTWR